MRPVAKRRPGRRPGRRSGRRSGRAPSRFSRQRPADGSVRPATMRSNVLLPQLEGPSRIRNSPRETVRSTPSSASSPDPKRFATSSTTTIGGGPDEVSGTPGRAGSELPDNPDKTQSQQHETDQLGRGQAFAEEAPG